MKEQLLELIFPPRCAVCTEVLDMEERRGILCHDCAEQLPYVPKGICPHCGGVTETAGFCDFCLKEFAFERLRRFSVRNGTKGNSFVQI